jgi:hypothetical protein
MRKRKFLKPTLFVALLLTSLSAFALRDNECSPITTFWGERRCTVVAENGDIYVTTCKFRFVISFSCETEQVVTY